MVFRVSRHLPLVHGFVEAARRNPLLWPPSLGHRRVAYASQFLDPDNRAHRGKAKIKARLIADLDPDEWELPPKPKWMRWRTYNGLEEKFDRYEKMLERGIGPLLAKLLEKYFSMKSMAAFELLKGFRFPAMRALERKAGSFQRRSNGSS